MHHPIQMKPADSEKTSGKWIHAGWRKPWDGDVEENLWGERLGKGKWGVSFEKGKIDSSTQHLYSAVV